MTAPAGLEEALGQFQKVVDESKQKDATIEQLKRLTDELRSSLEEMREKNEKFQEYEDIILDPDAEKAWQQVNIRSGKTYKDLLLRTQQLYRNTRPISVAAIVENCLNLALSSSGWRQVLRTRYDQHPEARRILGLPATDGEANAE
jgi:hypothetical protein